MRSRVCSHLAHLGVAKLEHTGTLAPATRLSTGPGPEIWVVQTDEEEQIALETLKTL